LKALLLTEPVDAVCSAGYSDAVYTSCAAWHQWTLDGTTAYTVFGTYRQPYRSGAIATGFSFGVLVSGLFWFCARKIGQRRLHSINFLLGLGSICPGNTPPPD
jgi:hypothetical protein